MAVRTCRRAVDPSARIAAGSGPTRARKCRRPRCAGRVASVAESRRRRSGLPAPGGTGCTTSAARRPGPGSGRRGGGPDRRPGPAVRGSHHPAGSARPRPDVGRCRGPGIAGGRRRTALVSRSGHRREPGQPGRRPCRGDRWSRRARAGRSEKADDRLPGGAHPRCRTRHASGPTSTATARGRAATKAGCRNGSTAAWGRTVAARRGTRPGWPDPAGPDHRDHHRQRRRRRRGRGGDGTSAPGRGSARNAFSHTDSRAPQRRPWSA